MNVSTLSILHRPTCPGDQEPLETLTPALREVVLLRARARRQIEGAMRSMQSYTVITVEIECIRARNEELARFVPRPMEQSDIDT